MDRQRTIGCVVLILALLIPTDRVFGGKLSGIRSAAKGRPTQARAPHSAAPTPKSSSRQDQDHSDNHDNHDNDEHRRQTPVVATASKPRQSPPKAGKLNEVRVAARSHEQARPVNQRQPRQQDAARHPEHRPSRSPSATHLSRRHGHPNNAAISFYSHYSSPVYLPTVVEEHHDYEPQPVVVAQPVVVPAPPPIVSFAPVAPPVEYATETIVVDEDPFEFLSPVQIRFEIDYATDEADVSRSGFGLLVNATGGFGVDTGVRMFRESGDDFRDHLWLGDFNVVYELFPTSFARTRAGAGVNWLADGYGEEAGFNLTLGTDLFAGPFTFSGEVDMGTLGDADLLHGRLTAALRQGDHLEWFAGYDYLDISGTEIRGVVGGIRFRF